MNRRGFLKALPAAPVAAKTAATQDVDAVAAKEMAFAGMHLQASVPMAMPWGVGILDDPKLWALHKAGILPEWAKREIVQQSFEQARYLAPDVASLKSVSTSGKYNIQQSRLERKLWEAADECLTMQRARRAFFTGNEDAALSQRMRMY